MPFGSGSRAPANPFYGSQNPPGTPPPAYTGSSGASRPLPPPPSLSASAPGEPVQYGSLSDLSKGKGQQSSQYSYQAQPERQGYTVRHPEAESSGGSAGRRMPPPPSNYGRETLPPPRRTPETLPSGAPAAAPAPTGVAGRASSYLPASAQGYANTAGSYASSGLERVRDGLGSIATQERKDQVLSGVGKVGAGAAKLIGKGAWQLGKLASK